MQNDVLKQITIEKKPGSLVVLTGELPFEDLEKHRASAVAEIAKNIEIDGFRKGHVPENILIQKVGEMALLNEMAERALSRAYPEMVAHHELDVIGYPQIGITKLAKGNPLGFTITVAVVPEIILPDYTKIAKDINKVKESKDVTDSEVDKQVEDILRQKVAYERLQAKAGEHKEHVHSEDCDHKVNDEGREGALGYDHEHGEHDHGEEETIEPEMGDKLPLPELTDEYVKTFGKPGQFEGVADFKAKIKEHLTIEKAREVDSRHRAKLTDAIIEKSELELPKVLVDAEINQMFAQMEDDLTRAQLKIDDYLTHIKKTREELVAEWTPNAEKRAKLQLVLNEIAKIGDVKPDEGRVDHEVSQLLEQYKDADEKRVRVYVASVLTNDAVMKMLEETM
jgi:trigger factor